ncbi:hypothetical protein [Methylobacterium sp.]|uniref:hypothetical protein n=1 Tax=Methylobacterium sp. TaxID=409 RepID=UPI003B00B0B7
MSPHWKISALALTIACVAPAPVAAQTKFDGRWSVSATVDGGSCTGPYRYPIVVRDGAVDDPGGSMTNASGRVADDGRIVGSIKSGLASIAVKGRLRAPAGSGRWNLAGPVSCSGRWTASKFG